MDDDEKAIRDLIATWMRATAEGDIQQLLPLMADDVVFLQPGQPPMRRDAFVAGFHAATQHARIDARSDIQEIHIVGNWAWCWNHLNVTMTPRTSGAPKVRSGYTLTILRKNPDGRWVIARDANLLAAHPE